MYFSILIDDGSELLTVVAFILLNEMIEHKISFLHRRLLPYSFKGSKIFQGSLHKFLIFSAGCTAVNIPKADYYTNY